MNAAPATVRRAHRRLPPLGRALARARRTPLAFDAAIAVTMALVTVGGSIGESHPNAQIAGVTAGHHVPAAPAAAYLLVAASALVLVWRRRRPEAVLLVSTACVVVYTCLGYVNGSAVLNPVVALYAVAVACGMRRAVAWSVLVTVALMAATAALNPFGATGGVFTVIPAEVAAALFLGLWVAGRRAYTEREAEDQARRAVDAERLRIARELHDVVAHTMATINVQAGVAAHVIDQQPGQAAEALAAIKAASGEGLRELRGILNVLRQADDSDPVAPAPRLAQLDTLIDGTTRAGLPTTLTVTGQPEPLAATADLAAYRIVQESLTNALRHAGPTTATVTLSYLDSELVLDVVDRGRGVRGERSSQGGGHGIAGMRERAEAAGGTLEAGSDPAGGYRVHARLPLGGAS
jgi:signal transduction histidine kinase